MTSEMTVDHRVSAVLSARLLGVGLVLVAVAVFVATLLVAWQGWSIAWVAGVAVVGLLGVAGAAWWLSHQVVLHLDEQGYRVAFVRGAGTREARWTEVEDLVTAIVASSPCLVLRLRDGRTTTIPVQAVAVDREALVVSVQDHLDAAGGNPRARRRRTA